ncbi:B12-binding domain-containing radical SAM protein [Candidatus Magnetominusculus xianensis]|uniref:B12-binding domain-containing radical SAM protein n=1 Tax=Candidatus Magnetominusculus xianensis TaxID=1748249 RepID=A0ABR5SG21_9BACT|nr:radical SAM protein [Candidatus Magnetominusculus xianensis]KWT87090.1 B12-binding domain-containing radical SAM protein [Candidatus Magnetominusculus xianensis]MBF0404986.1 radical SAM protein [Nitrospirota bacterium]
MGKLRIMLADLSYLNRLTLDLVYVPLNIGYVASYTKARFGDSVDIKLYKDPVRFLDDINLVSPHIVGFSLYFWNTDLTRILISAVRDKLGKEPVIVAGGPSIDIDPGIQMSLFNLLTGVDAIIPNDGELGFSNIVGCLLGSRKGILHNGPIDGVVMRDGTDLVVGREVGAAFDLKTLPSPYLTGILDNFLKAPYRPLIQTVRGCPHTCKFCAAGRSIDKLRQFPLEQVKEEITFIVSKYKGLSNLPLFVADLNFGVFDRDVDIAAFIKENHVKTGYPDSVEVYTDKRFSQRARAVMEQLLGLNVSGLIVALQSENEDTLKSVKRRNLESQEISEAISWARQHNIECSAEIIFGLPNETLQSFIEMLRRAYFRKFDFIHTVNLILFNGSVLNRASERKQHGIVTRFRAQGPSYMEIDGRFSAETSEVVIESNTFSFDDYLELRRLNFILFAIGSPGFYKLFFRGLDGLGVETFDFFLKFMSPNPDKQWNKEYIGFLSDLNKAFRSELYETADAVKEKLFNDYRRDNNEVTVANTINVLYTARLIWIERAWHHEVLLEHLRDFGITPNHDNKAWEAVNDLLWIGSKERVDLRNTTRQESLVVRHDVVAWQKDNFEASLQKYRISSPKRLMFFTSSSDKVKFDDFNKENSDLDDESYYYNALVIIKPRSILRCQCAWE